MKFNGAIQGFETKHYLILENILCGWAATNQLTMYQKIHHVMSCHVMSGRKKVRAYAKESLLLHANLLKEVKRRK